jgi:peptide/nickel transport system substrate-binding protein
VLDAAGQWGTGPFILSSGYSSIANAQATIVSDPFAATWITTKEERTPYVVLDANHQYWNQNRGPRLEKVVFRNDLSKREALELCISTEGQVDIVTQVSPNDAPKVRESKNASLVHTYGNQVLSGIFNRYQRDVHFNDYKLRMALNLAIDRNILIQEGINGFADIVPALTPPWAPDFPEDLSPRRYNPSLSQKYFNEANWPNGRELRIATTEKYHKMASLLSFQIRETLGIDVVLIRIPSKEEAKSQRIVAEKKLVPNWDILLGNATALFYEDTPVYFHRAFFGHDGAIRTGPQLPEFDRLFKRMASEVDKEKRKELSKKIDRYVFKEALGLFLFVPKQIYAVNKHVHFRPYLTTLEFADTEVGEGHWSKKI